MCFYIIKNEKNNKTKIGSYKKGKFLFLEIL